VDIKTSKRNLMMGEIMGAGWNRGLVRVRSGENLGRLKVDLEMWNVAF
jgi:hypothetical protein